MKIKIARTHYEYIAACSLILKDKLHFTDKDGSFIKSECERFLKMKTDVQPFYVNEKLKWTFNKQKHERPFFIVCLIYDELNDLIGCILVWSRLTSFFIKKKYRRNGYITKAWKQLKRHFILNQKVVNTGYNKEASYLRNKLQIPKSFCEMRSMEYHLRQHLNKRKT